MMPDMTSLSIGDRTPEFSLDGIDGKSYSVRHSGSHLTLLTFFKNTCPTCILTLPFLQRLYQRVEGTPLRFWGVSQDSLEETRDFGEQHALSFPLLPDGPGYPVSNAFGLTSVPTLLLVEPDGRIAWRSIGFVKADLEALATLLHQRLRVPGLTPLFLPAEDVPAIKPG